jgi:hypothetical protein
MLSFLLRPFCFYGLSPLAISSSELTYDGVNPLRHLIEVLAYRISPPQSLYLTQDHINTQETQAYIYAPSEIRIHDPSISAVKDSTCFRPHGHCDRLLSTIILINVEVIYR